MNVTTGSRGLFVEDRGQEIENARTCHRAPSVLRPLSSVFCLAVLCLLVFLGGCDRKALEQAQQEAREAKTEAQKLKLSLALAQKEITTIRAELSAVRQSRDELQGRLDQAGGERDQALESARKIQEEMAAQFSGQMSTVASLRKQVAELTALVAEQLKQIEQQKEAAAAPSNQTPVADPNEDL